MKVRWSSLELRRLAIVLLWATLCPCVHGFKAEEFKVTLCYSQLIAIYRLQGFRLPKERSTRAVTGRVHCRSAPTPASASGTEAFLAHSTKSCPKTVSLQKQHATARIQNTASKTELDLTVTAVGSSFRVNFDEKSSSPRFQVPGVLLDQVGKSSTSWTNSKQSGKGISLQLGTAALNINFSPFQFELVVDGTPAVRFNERQLFDWEQHREKQVSEMSQKLACGQHADTCIPCGLQFTAQVGTLRRSACPDG